MERNTRHSSQPHVRIANVEFNNVTMQETVAHILHLVKHADQPAYVCTGNLDHLVQLDRDAEFRAVYAGADLVLADGAPVVWLSRLAPGGPLKERVTGSDLFWELGRASAATGARLFFLGGSPGSAYTAADEVRRCCPGAQISGTYCPARELFDDPEEQKRIHAAIRAAHPDILLVGFGAPKQEKWIAANKYRMGVPVSIGVGGSFEMAGGIVHRAPLWMQRSGLEWVYRLCQEPGRLWKRYFLRDLPFLVKLVGRSIMDRIRPNRPQDASPECHLPDHSSSESSVSDLTSHYCASID